MFVSGVGTGGTLTGVSRYIKGTKGKKILTVAVEPTHSPVISQTLAGQPLDPDSAQDSRHRRRVHPEESGSVAGRSRRAGEQRRGHRHGARAWRARRASCPGSRAAPRWRRRLRLAREPAQAGKTIVVVLPDAGERYLSGALFEGLFEEVEKMQAVA